MRLRTFLFLPIFLLATFFFRMYSLSFVSVNSHVMRSHQAMRVKRKFECTSPRSVDSQIKVKDNSTGIQCLRFKRTKGCISSSRRRTLSQTLLLLLNFMVPRKENTATFHSSYSETSPSSLPRYLALAVIRI